MTQNTLIHTEAIVIKQSIVKEKDILLTLFTPQSGLLKLYVKGKKGNAFAYQALMTPFTLGEYIYKPGKKDLGSYYDGSIIDQNLKLRERFELLEAAQYMGHALLQSQWIGKPSPQLYALFKIFLKKLPEASYPDTIFLSFLIKVLHHEGSLDFSPPCSCCQEKYRFKGEVFCSKNAPLDAQSFSDIEEKALYFLACSRSFDDISSFPFENAFKKKIESLFLQSITL